MTTTMTRPTAQATGTPPPGQQPRQLRARTRDDRLSVRGAAISSFFLTWLLYGQILPLFGLLGFILSWYVLFLALYAAISRIGNPRPVVADRIAGAAVRGGAFVVGLALATTVVFTFWKGLPALIHWNFYFETMGGVGPTAPLTKGGVLHAIVGSVIELGIAIVVALPLGIATAIYMTEVRGRLSTIVRTVIEAMTALPDILAGLFIYVVLIVGLGFPKSGLAAGLALSVTMLPIIARAADVVLRVVPGGLKEAALALGATQWRTVLWVVLPTALPGLATALILGMARAVGETAPVLLTSGASTFLNGNPLHYTMNSLPLFIFTAVRSGQPLFISRGFGAASILLALVLVLFAVTRWLARIRVGGR
jgi:phosphate transport system permease protein